MSKPKFYVHGVPGCAVPGQLCACARTAADQPSSCLPAQRPHAPSLCLSMQHLWGSLSHGIFVFFWVFSCFYLMNLCYSCWHLLLALAYVPGCDCPCLLAQPCCVSCAGKLCMSMQHLWLSLLSSMLQAEGKGTGRAMLQRPQSLCIAVLVDDIRARS